VTWQIVSGLGQAHAFRGGSSYPAPFSYFVNMIEVFMFDFFTFFHTECVARTAYTDKLMVALMTILSSGVIAVASGAFCAHMWGGTILRSSGVKNYILLVYLVLPIMSSMAVSAFNCDEVSSFVRGYHATKITNKPATTRRCYPLILCNPRNTNLHPRTHHLV